MSMRAVEVTTKKQHNQFIELPKRLYHSISQYITPLDRDIAQVFDPQGNPTYKQGNCIRWLLMDKEKVVGRIAAFSLLRGHNNQDDELAGGIGFFECIDDQAAANILFDTARHWLLDKGCTYMDGPINFGKRDSWWGLLTKGFELEPNYHSNYHFPYYTSLFESYGFQVYYKHYTYLKDTRVRVDEKLQKKAEIVAADPNYEIRNFDKKNFKKQVADIMEIYNKAWVQHEGVSPMTYTQALTLFERIRPIIDSRIMWLMYYKEQPVGFYLNIPEVNQIFKRVGSKLGLFGTLKFLWYQRTLKNDKMLGIVFGVIPEHQSKGLDGALVLRCYNDLQKLKGSYNNLEISGIGDFNRKMIIVVRQVGGNICKVHSTYRYLFDRTLPFERMSPI